MLINALAAAEGGAAVLTRTAFTGARRVDGVWQAGLADTRTGQRRTVRARCIVNAAGPWVEQVLGRSEGVSSRRRVRLVKGSHIVTQKWWDGPQCYVLQHTDKRLLFINPWQDDLTLCGTTDIPYEGEPDDVAIDEREDRVPDRGHQPLLPAPGEARGHRPQLLGRAALCSTTARATRRR